MNNFLNYRFLDLLGSHEVVKPGAGGVKCDHLSAEAQARFRKKAEVTVVRHIFLCLSDTKGGEDNVTLRPQNIIYALLLFHAYKVE